MIKITNARVVRGLLHAEEYPGNTSEYPRAPLAEWKEDLDKSMVLPYYQLTNCDPALQLFCV